MKNTNWIIIVFCVALAATFTSCASKDADKTPSKSATGKKQTIASKSIECDKTGPATVYHSGVTFDDKRAKENYQLIANYWGGSLEADEVTGNFKGEKRNYSVSEGVLKDLLNQASDRYKDSIAIRVSDIENADKAQIDWVACDGTFEKEIENEACLTFFLVSKDVFFLPVEKNHDHTGEKEEKLAGIFYTQQKGLQVTKDKGKVGFPITTNAVTARLGKDDKRQYVILSPTFSHIINYAGGSGTHATGIGHRLPPGSGN
jgi:hypothetical protein